MSRISPLILTVLSLLLATPLAHGQHRVASAHELSISRELSMRSLPAYRIGPPDVLQIEIISPKNEKTDEHQSASPVEQGDQHVGTKREADKGVLTKTGSGTLTLSGSNTYTGNTVIVGTENSTPTTTGTVTTFSVNSDNNTGATFVGEGKLAIVGDNNPPNKNSGTLTIGSDKTYIFESTNDNSSPNRGVVVVGSEPSTLSGSSVGWTSGNAVGSTCVIKTDSVTVSGAQFQPSSGQYLVAPDGTVNLRQYGLVQLSGKTIPEAKLALEKHLAKYIDSPQVTVDVLGYNSKVYYVITDGAGMGDNVRRFPISGNETVLDAISMMGGLSQLSSKKMWIARPTPNSEKGTILSIDYEAITRHGSTTTNYQILPGDRIFIEADREIALNNRLGKKTAPLERAMGLISLATSTFQRRGGEMGNADKDGEMAEQPQKPTVNRDEIESNLMESMYRYLQQMTPMLDKP